MEKRRLVTKTVRQNEQKIDSTVYEEVEDRLLKFDVIIVQTDGKNVFCKHKDKHTLESPGGHREAPGEGIFDTAKRELYEETGAVDFDFKPTCHPAIQPQLMEEAVRRGNI